MIQRKPFQLNVPGEPRILLRSDKNSTFARKKGLTLPSDGLSPKEYHTLLNLLVVRAGIPWQTGGLNPKASNGAVFDFEATEMFVFSREIYVWETWHDNEALLSLEDRGIVRCFLIPIVKPKAGSRSCHKHATDKGGNLIGDEDDDCLECSILANRIGAYNEPRIDATSLMNRPSFHGSLQYEFMPEWWAQCDMLFQPRFSWDQFDRKEEWVDIRYSLLHELASNPDVDMGDELPPSNAQPVELAS